MNQITDKKWSREWPTTDGYYWFYGWCFSDDSDKPDIYSVRVKRVSNGYVYITNGHFIYKTEGASGLWILAELPDTNNLSS